MYRLPRAVLVSLREAGVDVDRLAARVGLEPAAFDSVLGAADVDAFLTLALAAVPPWFGLILGSDIRPELWGVVGLAAMSSPTFGAALARIGRYKRVMTGDDMVLLAGRGETVVRLHVTDGRSSYARQKIDSELAFLVSLGRRLTGAPIQPIRIAIELSRPAYHDRYEALFRCPIAFDQPTTELVFHDSDLARPLVSANDELAELVTERADRLLASEQPVDTAGRVHLALRGTLRGEVPAVAAIARQLHLSERTLQRQLRDQGTSFKRIVDEVRLELARRYLRNVELQVAEISYLLGFSHPNSFFRAFKRWTGRTPEEYRARIEPTGPTDLGELTCLADRSDRTRRRSAFP